jgi:hypothetical protein
MLTINEYDIMSIDHNNTIIRYDTFTCMHRQARIAYIRTYVHTACMHAYIRTYTYMCMHTYKYQTDQFEAQTDVTSSQTDLEVKLISLSLKLISSIMGKTKRSLKLIS